MVGGDRREAKVTPFQAEGSFTRSPLLPQSRWVWIEAAPARLSEGSPAAHSHLPLRSTLRMCQSATAMTVECISSLSAPITVQSVPPLPVPLVCSVSMWS